MKPSRRQVEERWKEIKMEKDKEMKRDIHNVIETE